MRSGYRCVDRTRRLAWEVAISVQLVAGTSFAAGIEDPTGRGTDDNSVLKPYAAFDIGHDSNVLRLPNITGSQAIGAGSSLSDTWQKIAAGFALDEKFSEQRLLADVDVAKWDFDRLEQLDHYDKNADVIWKWHTAENFDGNLGATYQEALAPYIDFHLLERNLRTQESEFADGSWLFDPRWRVRAGYTSFHVIYDLASQKPEDRTEERAELGFDYIALSGSNVGVQLRHITAYFPTPQQVGAVTVGNNYAQDEVKAKIDWVFSAITQFHFLGGWVRRRYDEFDVRDYSGPNARLSADWSPTRRLAINIASWREIESVDDLTAAFSLNHGSSAGLKWDISERFQAQADYKYERQNFSQAATIGAAPFLADAIRNASLMLTYKPTRKMSMQTTIARLLQHQFDPSSGFASNSIFFRCRYDF